MGCKISCYVCVAGLLKYHIKLWFVSILVIYNHHRFRQSPLLIQNLSIRVFKVKFERHFSHFLNGFLWGPDKRLACSKFWVKYTTLKCTMRGGISNGPKCSVMRKCEKGSKFRSLTLRLMKNCSDLILTKKDYLHAQIARLYLSLSPSLSSFGYPVSHIGSCCHVRSRGCEWFTEDTKFIF